MDCATDLEYIVSLGFSAADARAALKGSSGDRLGALAILRRVAIDGNINAEDLSWREEMTGDWQTGVADNQPRSGESRGLWKIRVYATVVAGTQAMTNRTSAENWAL